jgi:hypothetical protein
MGYCQSRETRVSMGNHRKALTDADQAAGIQPRMSRTRIQLKILDFQAAALEKASGGPAEIAGNYLETHVTRVRSVERDQIQQLPRSTSTRGKRRSWSWASFEDRRRAQKVRRSFGREGAVKSSKLRPTPTGLPRFRARKNSRNPGASDTYLNAKRDVGVCPLTQ